MKKKFIEGDPVNAVMSSETNTGFHIPEMILNFSENAIIIVDLHNNIMAWNKEAEKMFGYTREEVIGRSINVIIPPQNIEEDELMMQRVREGEEVKYTVAPVLTKRGIIKNVMQSVFLVTDANRGITGTLRMVKDLSFRGDAEEKQAMLAAIVDSSGDAIISKTLQGIITSWNPAAVNMFGYSEEEAIGQHISIIIPEDRMEEETLIINSISSGRKVEHFNTIRRAKDGSLRQISLTVSPIKNYKGEITGASKVARDISLWVDAEKQKDTYTKQLEELNKYKDEFMVMASHELKTPLTVILANLEILRMIMEQDSKVSFVNKTHKQVMKLANLISNLLDVTKMQSGKIDLKISSFDINLLLKETINYIQQSTQIHTIIYHSPPGEIIINADRERMEQVIVNILGNSIKYMTGAGEIIVDLLQKGENILIKVQDSGIGIPERDLQNIFDRFYRVSGAASSFSGSGIGLYISAEIIKAHGGKIWAESEIGKGSVFYISMPG